MPAETLGQSPPTDPSPIEQAAQQITYAQAAAETAAGQGSYGQAASARTPEQIRALLAPAQGYRVPESRLVLDELRGLAQTQRLSAEAKLRAKSKHVPADSWQRPTLSERVQLSDWQLGTVSDESPRLAPRPVEKPRPIVKDKNFKLSPWQLGIDEATPRQVAAPDLVPAAVVQNGAVQAQEAASRSPEYRGRHRRVDYDLGGVALHSLGIARPAPDATETAPPPIYQQVEAHRLSGDLASVH